MNIAIPAPTVRWRLHHSLLLVVLLLGLLIRFHGLIWTLPYFFLGDETRVVYNGITIEQMGVQGYTTNITNMGNYPPYRGWEVALTSSVLKLLFGQEVGGRPGLLVLFGRMFSLAYALLTIVFLYKLGHSATHNPYVGVIAALFFAVWSETVLFGQRVLSDGAGLMFFVLCAWLSVRAFQRVSYRALVLAVLAGILAGFGKYNYFPALILPVLAGSIFLVKRPRQMLIGVIFPSFLLAAPILYFANKTVSRDDLFYNYLNEKAQLESELRRLQLDGYSPDSDQWRAMYWRYPLTLGARLHSNYQIFVGFMPALTFGLTLLGIGALFVLRGQRLDYLSLLALGLCSLLILVAFSLFRMVEGRQLFGAAALLLVFWAVGIVGLARFSAFGAGLVLAMVALPSAVTAWNMNNEISKPDTRVATVNWFLEHARSGTGIVIENEPYEFWEQNGYQADKHFNVIRAYRLFEKQPPDWENEGFYYLVADRSYAFRGGYYAGHPLQEYWDAYVEEVARFEGEAYSGPDRIIMRVFRPQVKVEVDFGEVVTFYGYNLDQQSLERGQSFKVKYYWQARQPDGRDYIIFNHLININSGEVLLQYDRLAGHSGTHPSSQWESLEWLFDEFTFTIPSDAPDGTYRLQMGLYDALTSQRLPVEGGENGILPLFEITVESGN